MIVKETIVIGDNEYLHTYSDSGMYIEREGALYSDAVDPLLSDREYIETDIPIETDETIE